MTRPWPQRQRSKQSPSINLFRLLTEDLMDLYFLSLPLYPFHMGVRGGSTECTNDQPFLDLLRPLCLLLYLVYIYLLSTCSNPTNNAISQI